MITISYCNKAEQPCKRKQTTTARAVKRYSVSHVKSQKIQNLDCNSLTVWMHPVFIVDSSYPKRVRSHLCLGKLGSVKLIKYKSGRSEKRSQRFRIASFILIRGRPRQVNVRNVKRWASKGPKTVTKWSSQSSAAAATASPVITLTNSY